MAATTHTGSIMATTITLVIGGVDAGMAMVLEPVGLGPHMAMSGSATETICERPARFQTASGQPPGPFLSGILAD